MYNSKWMHIFQILLGLNYFSWKHSVQKCYPVPTWGIRTNSNKMSYSNPQVYHPPLTSFFLPDILRNFISTHLNGWIVASWKMATIHPARTDFYEWTKKIKKKKVFSTKLQQGRLYPIPCGSAYIWKPGKPGTKSKEQNCRCWASYRLTALGTWWLCSGPSARLVGWSWALPRSTGRCQPGLRGALTSGERSWSNVRCLQKYSSPQELCISGSKSRFPFQPTYFRIAVFHQVLGLLASKCILAMNSLVGSC